MVLVLRHSVENCSIGFGNCGGLQASSYNPRWRIKNLVYLAFRSKITSALQAILEWGVYLVNDVAEVYNIGFFQSFNCLDRLINEKNHHLDQFLQLP